MPCYLGAVSFLGLWFSPTVLGQQQIICRKKPATELIFRKFLSPALHFPTLQPEARMQVCSFFFPGFRVRRHLFPDLAAEGLPLAAPQRQHETGLLVRAGTERSNRRLQCHCLNVLLSLLFWQGLVTTAVLRPAA